MSGGGRCLEMRGSRLANWLLPRDSFAERALWNGRCWREKDIGRNEVPGGKWHHLAAGSGHSGLLGIAVRHRQPKDIHERSGNSLKRLRELGKISAENDDCLEALRLLDASCRMRRSRNIKVREG